jgi:YfiH family protein
VSIFGKLRSGGLRRRWLTNTAGVALLVFTADCTPILLWDSATGAVGAVHAGWRGTAASIAGKTVAAMVANFGTRPEDIRAAIGPNIGQCHFETDRDVPDAALATFGEAAEPYIRKAGAKYYVNLKELNALALRRVGVTHIEISDECTVCRLDRYWSQRANGYQRGNQGAIILCKEGSK